MLKKRIRLVRASFFFLFFLLLCGGFTSRSSASDPFTIGPSNAIHEEILYWAFEEAVDRGAMTSSLIDGITAGNRHADLWHSDNLELHFSLYIPIGWQLSAQCIADWKSSAAYQLMQGDYDNAKESIGRFTHTVADFFAHSNWVEHHQGCTIEGLEFDPWSNPWSGWLRTIGNGGVTEKDVPGSSAWFSDAYRAARDMTYKVFVDWINSLYDTFNPEEVNSRLFDLGYQPLIILMEEDSQYKKLGNSCTIHWRYGLLDPTSPVRISLLKEGAWLGDITEVTLMNNQYEWQVGTYYDNQGWHTANPYDGAYYQIQITYVNKPLIKKTYGLFRIVEFVFTDPTGYDTWYIGEDRYITWWPSIYLNGTDAVLTLYKGGAWYGEIAYLDENALNSGYYNWHLNQQFNIEPGDDYQIGIKLSSMDFPILSNGFSIRSWQ